MEFTSVLHDRATPFLFAEEKLRNPR